MTDPRANERPPSASCARDQRGRLLPLYPIHRYVRTSDNAQTLPEPVFAAIRQRLLSRTRAGMPARPRTLIVIACVNFGVLLLPSPYGVVRDGMLFWLLVISAALCLITAVGYRYRVPQASDGLIKEAMLAHARCPSCAYDLTGAKADGDNITTCPECGGAWIVPSPP